MERWLSMDIVEGQDGAMDIYGHSLRAGWSHGYLWTKLKGRMEHSYLWT